MRTLNLTVIALAVTLALTGLTTSADGYSGKLVWLNACAPQTMWATDLRSGTHTPLLFTESATSIGRGSTGSAMWWTRFNATSGTGEIVKSAWNGAGSVVPVYATGRGIRAVAVVPGSSSGSTVFLVDGLGRLLKWDAAKQAGEVLATYDGAFGGGITAMVFNATGAHAFVTYDSGVFSGGGLSVIGVGKSSASSLKSFSNVTPFPRRLNNVGPEALAYSDQNSYVINRVSMTSGAQLSSAAVPSRVGGIAAPDDGSSIFFASATGVYALDGPSFDGKPVKIADLPPAANGNCIGGGALYVQDAPVVPLSLISPNNGPADGRTNVYAVFDSKPPSQAKSCEFGTATVVAENVAPRIVRCMAPAGSPGESTAFSVAFDDGSVSSTLPYHYDD